MPLLPNIIGNLRLRYKMLLLVSVPFAVLALFAVKEIYNNHIHHNTAVKFRALNELSLTSSALVHELQKERGASAGFISSGGLKFEKIVQDQRKLTNEKLDAFRSQLSVTDDTQYGTELSQTLETIIELTSRLDSERLRVQSLTVSVADQVAYYTSINKELLHISDFLGRFSASGEVANSAAAYAALLQSKERAGIERAVLSTVFSVDKFSAETLARFSNLVNTQEIYLMIFSSMANEESMEFFKKEMSGDGVLAVERMRSIASQNAETGGFGVDPVVWFEESTKRIGLLKSVENHLAAELFQFSKTDEQQTITNFWRSVVVLCIAGIISLALLFRITHAVDRSVSKAMALANNIANGDLTGDYASSDKDEVGCLLTALNVMQDKLSQVIGESIFVSNSVSDGAKEIYSSSEKLQNKTSEQSKSVESTASSSEEISATTKRNAAYATEARQVALEASTEADHGGTVVSRAIEAMSEINVASKEIANITSVIDEIAFQTNLLALNAAVEAARAGEQGRGFAVVASEVRNLAGRSSEAAKEIKGLIEDSVEKVEAGAAYVDESGEALEKIVKSVNEVNNIILDIANASQEQATGIDMINDAITRINKLAHENRGIVESTSMASRSMADQAHSLSDNLDFFTIKGKSKC